MIAVKPPVSICPMTRRKLVFTALVHEGGSTRQITVTGQNARALLALVEAGPKGCTALEVSTWAYRFAAYTFVLIHEHGLNIVTEREEHPGGWHGRHILLDRVTIVSVTDGAARRKPQAAPAGAGRAA